MNKNYEKLIAALGENKVSRDSPMALYTSFKIGGPADLFYRAKTIQELVTAIKAANKLSIPYFILGGGTNILVSDKGIRGLVIKNDTNKITLAGIRGNKDASQTKTRIRFHTAFIKAESGVMVNRLVRFTLDEGFGGLEPFLGQPGTVGGAVFINAHNMKMGKYFTDVLVEAKILNKRRQIVDVPVDYFKFGYDQSLIQKTGEIILSVMLKLTVNQKDVIWEKAQEALNYRTTSQPMGKFSAGCIFKNIPLSDAMRLGTPNHTRSAGFLIECVSLKGMKVGQAQISSQHANFIVNLGKASESQVSELIDLVEKKVKNKFGVSLEKEIVFVGER